MKTGNNQDYDEFKNWYTNEAPDESELNMVDMAYLAWTQGKAALSQQDAVTLDLENELQDAISEYFQVGFRHGEQRLYDHDDKEGSAQNALSKIQGLLRQALHGTPAAPLSTAQKGPNTRPTKEEYLSAAKTILSRPVRRSASQPTAQGAVMKCASCGWRGTQKDYDAMLSRGCLACCPEKKLTAAPEDHIVDANKLVKPTAQGVEPFEWSNFVSYLIDHCEGDTITEERLQHALLDMTATKYCPSMPAAHHEAELRGVVVNNNLASNQILLAHPPCTTIPVGTVMIACPHPDVAHDCCVVCGKNIMPNKPDFEWEVDLSSPPLDDGMVKVPVEIIETLQENVRDKDCGVLRLGIRDNDIVREALSRLFDEALRVSITPESKPMDAIMRASLDSELHWLDTLLEDPDADSVTIPRRDLETTQKVYKMIDDSLK